jgi:acetyl esterase
MGKPASGMVGRTYLERGRQVVVLVRWGPGGGPRNVLIRRADGSQVVRPFRGLRRPKDTGGTPA